MARKARRYADRESFLFLLAMYGITDEDRQRIDSEGVYSPLPEGDWQEAAVQVTRSDLHGSGLFSLETREAGERIGWHTYGGEISEIGQFLNHSASPNCKLDFEPFDPKEWSGLMPVGVVTVSTVYAGEELTINYDEIFSRQHRKVEPE